MRTYGYQLDEKGSVVLASKDESFAQAIQEGFSPMAAAGRAGYSATNERGMALLARPGIQARLRQLQGYDHDDTSYAIRYKSQLGEEKAKKSTAPIAEIIPPGALVEVDQEWTRSDLLRKQREILELAQRNGNLAQANVAVKQLAQLMGEWVDKTENKNTNENIDTEFDPEDLAQRFLAKISAPPED